MTLWTADTANDLNRLHYTIFGDPVDVNAARRTLLAGMEKITNSLSGDVALNNTGTYFVGPTVAQGTSGTWHATGTVCVTDTNANSNFNVKLWDGTTVISSAKLNVATASGVGIITLDGTITSPAGNIRMSVNDISSTSGSIVFNASGNSKDSTLTAIRIG